MTDATTDPPRPRRANGWPVLPMRLFLAAVFLFAGYAKLVYPHFLDPNSTTGFRASVAAARSGTPIGGVLGPLTDHASLFGHLTAYAEIAIGLGLLVGLLTRLAAAGGMVLMAMIVLSVDWGGVKEYTGSSGWFTSVDLAVAAALSVFLLGGADPFSLNALFWRARLRRRARDDAEPGFRDNELAESRARLQGEPYPTEQYPAERYPDSAERHPDSAERHPDSAERYPAGSDTERLPAVDEDSLWNDGRPVRTGHERPEVEPDRNESRADRDGPRMARP